MPSTGSATWCDCKGPPRRRGRPPVAHLYRTSGGVRPGRTGRPVRHSCGELPDLAPITSAAKKSVTLGLPKLSYREKPRKPPQSSAVAARSQRDLSSRPPPFLARARRETGGPTGPRRETAGRQVAAAEKARPSMSTATGRTEGHLHPANRRPVGHAARARPSSADRRRTLQAALVCVGRLAAISITTTTARPRSRTG